MKRNFWLVVFLVLQFICLPCYAAERRKSLSMDDLQNPRSPSYVPIPYPQTDEEVIADLKYYFKMRMKMKGSCSSSGYDRTMKSFVEGRDVVVGEILKIKNKLVERQRDYIFFIRLKTKDNIRVADVSLDSSGVYLASSYLDIDMDDLKSRGVKQCHIYEPYLDKKSIRKQFKETLGYELSEKEMNSIQLVEGKSPIATSLRPACEITLKDGKIFYFSFNPKAIYSVESEDQASENNVTAVLQKNFARNQRAMPFMKSTEDKILFVTELWREK